MELIALWQMLWRRWWLIALPLGVAVLVTLPALGDVVSPSVTYEVQVRLTAATPPSADLTGVTTPYEDAVYVPLLASEFVVLNIPHWISSDSFAAEVSALLAAQDVEITAADLSGAFRGDSFHSIMVLFVNWDDADELRLMTEAAITVLQTRNHVYFAQFVEPLEIIPLDDVDVAEMPPPLTVRVLPLLRIILGLVAGVGLAVLAEYLDDTVYARADLEALDLPVLAEIPRE